MCELNETTGKLGGSLVNYFSPTLFFMKNILFPNIKGRKHLIQGKIKLGQKHMNKILKLIYHFNTSNHDYYWSIISSPVSSAVFWTVLSAFRKDRLNQFEIISYTWPLVTFFPMEALKFGPQVSFYTAALVFYLFSIHTPLKSSQLLNTMCQILNIQYLFIISLLFTQLKILQIFLLT